MSQHELGSNSGELDIRGTAGHSSRAEGAVDSKATVGHFERRREGAPSGCITMGVSAPLGGDFTPAEWEFAPHQAAWPAFPCGKGDVKRQHRVMAHPCFELPGVSEVVPNHRLPLRESQNPTPRGFIEQGVKHLGVQIPGVQRWRRWWPVNRAHISSVGDAVEICAQMTVVASDPRAHPGESFRRDAGILGLQLCAGAMTALLLPWPSLGTIDTMDMSQVWPRLATSTQTWLVEHNGEPVPDDILDEILTITAGQRDPRWWAGESHEGETQLPTRLSIG